MVRCHVSAAWLALALAACVQRAPGENVGQSSSAATYPNDQTAFDYFLGKGLTKFQAAGIVGNLDQESGVDPTAVQSGGPGRGIAQWSVGGRWDTSTNDNAMWYAGTVGQNVMSLQLQLDFIWYELTTFPGYGLAQLQATTNLTDATVVFQTDFEICGACNQSARIANAQNVLNAFGADVVDGGSHADGPTGVPCTVTTTGTMGQCLDTAACAALGNHISTPGFCPGPANIECCTATASGNDAGGAGDGALPGDAALIGDASTADGAATPDGGGGAAIDPHGASGGCDFAGARGSAAREGLLVAMLVLLVLRRRVVRPRRS